MYLEYKKGLENKLMSGTFWEIQNTLGNIKERSAEGIKIQPEWEPIIEEHEKILWQK